MKFVHKRRIFLEKNLNSQKPNNISVTPKYRTERMLLKSNRKKIERKTSFCLIFFLINKNKYSLINSNIKSNDHVVNLIKFVCFVLFCMVLCYFKQCPIAFLQEKRKKSRGCSIGPSVCCVGIGHDFCSDKSKAFILACP